MDSPPLASVTPQRERRRQNAGDGSQKGKLTMLSKSDIRKLNAARKVLRSITSDAEAAGYLARGNGYPDADEGGYGRLAEAADLAESLVFNVLNVANAHRIADVSDADMHMREEIETNAERPRACG